MAAPKSPSRGKATGPTLGLNWAAESLDESVRTRREAGYWEQPGRPDLPVLTGVLAAQAAWALPRSSAGRVLRRPHC